VSNALSIRLEICDLYYFSFHNLSMVPKVSLASPIRIFTCLFIVFFLIPLLLGLRSDYRPIEYTESTNLYILIVTFLLCLVSAFERPFSVSCSRLSTTMPGQVCDLARLSTLNVVFVLLVVYIVVSGHSFTNILLLYFGDGDRLAAAAARAALIKDNPDIISVKIFSYLSGSVAPVLTAVNIWFQRLTFFSRSRPGKSFRLASFVLLSFVSIIFSLLLWLVSGTRSEIFFGLVPGVLLILTFRADFTLYNLARRLLLPAVLSFFFLLIINMMVTGVFTSNAYAGYDTAEILHIQFRELLARALEGPYDTAHIYQNFQDYSSLARTRESYAYYEWFGPFRGIISGSESLPRVVGYWHQNLLDSLYSHLSYANVSFIFANKFLFGPGFGLVLSMLQLFSLSLFLVLPRAKYFRIVLLCVIFGNLFNLGVNSFLFPSAYSNLFIAYLICLLLFRSR